MDIHVGEGYVSWNRLTRPDGGKNDYADRYGRICRKKGKVECWPEVITQSRFRFLRGN